MSASTSAAADYVAPESTKRRILDALKRADSLTAVDLAAATGVTQAAVRLHLDELSERGLVVARVRPPTGPGRPATGWRLTELADGLFPDRHAELSVHLIAAIRTAFGERGLDAIVDARSDAQRVDYSRTVRAAMPLRDRLAALAELRSAEGYMAEVATDETGADLLIEHHCPICDAAQACQGICRGELSLFRSVLGDDVEVERVDHLLAGDQRCVYRITPS